MALSSYKSRIAVGLGVLQAIAFPLAIVCSTAGDSLATQLSDKFLLEANTVSYDLPDKIVTARGNVLIQALGNRVRADSVQLNDITHDITAEGNIALVDAQGNAFYADAATLSQELSQGILSGIRARFRDTGRLVARYAERHNDQKTTFHEVDYTPCHRCKQDSKRPPLWSATAQEIVHDQQKHMISYRDVKLKVLGVPVLYSPFMSHPDNTVKRKSGWLAPTSAFSKNLGFYAAAPYYWDIAPNRDLTLTPHISTKLGVVLGADYRHRACKGTYTLGGSLTRDQLILNSQAPLTSSERKVRWHVMGQGDFDIRPDVRLGLKIERTSDQTYLKRFRFFELWNRPSLTSSANLAYFGSQHFTAIENATYQGLHEAYVTDKVPTILPDVLSEHWTHPGAWWGGTGTLRLQGLNLTRASGAEVQRIITSGRWKRPLIFDNGMLTDITFNLRHDLYHVQNYDPNDPDYFNPLPIPAGTTLINNTKSRLTPQLALAWRYPWIRHLNNASITLQPVITAIVSPNQAPSLSIPNEDSRLFELDESNIMRESRVAGYDVIDAGSRLVVGGQIDCITHRLQGSFFLGQAVLQTRNLALGQQSGIDTRRSDYLARLNVMYPGYVQGMVRLRLDEQSLDLKSTDIAVKFGPPHLQVHTHYFFLNPNVATGTSGSRQQITMGLRSKATETLTLFGEVTRDLGETSRLLQFSTGTTFQNECLSVTAEIYRSLLQDRDVKPDIGLRFKVILKNFSQTSDTQEASWSMLEPMQDMRYAPAQGLTSNQLAPPRPH